MYLVTFDLLKIKKKIGAGANFGEGGPEKQLFFLPWPKLSVSLLAIVLTVRRYHQGKKILSLC